MAKDSSQSTDTATADDGAKGSKQTTADEAAKTKATGAKTGADSGTDDAGKTEQEATEDRRELDRRINRAVQNAIEREREKHKAELEAKEQELEQQKLAEQGKYRELFEAKEDELISLRAEIAAKEFHEKSHSALVEDIELPESIAGALLAVRDAQTVGDIKKAGDAVKALLDAGVKATVKERLETGEPPPSGAKPPPSSDDLARLARTDPIAYQKRKAELGIIGGRVEPVVEDRMYGIAK